MRGNKEVWAREVLYKLAYRIRKAAKKGKGVRITANEAELLQYYNLPCTGEDPSVGLEADELDNYKESYE